MWGVGELEAGMEERVTVWGPDSVRFIGVCSDGKPAGRSLRTAGEIPESNGRKLVERVERVEVSAAAVRDVGGLVVAFDVGGSEPMRDGAGGEEERGILVAGLSTLLDLSSFNFENLEACLSFFLPNQLPVSAFNSLRGVMCDADIGDSPRLPHGQRALLSKDRCTGTGSRRVDDDDEGRSAAEVEDVVV